MDKRKKMPPFGKLLADRQRFKNSPWLVAVCVGGDAWQSAKVRNGRGDSLALVLPAGDRPAAYVWPVQGCLCVIEWSQGPSEALIVELVRSLLTNGAEAVAVWPRWVAVGQPYVQYDATKPVGERWVQVRESIRVYHTPRKEVVHAA